MAATPLYPSAVGVTLTLEFHDFNGDPVVPIALALVVTDEDGDVVHTATPAFTTGDTEAEITIPASANVLSSGVTGARNVELRLELAAGGYIPVTTAYLIRSATELVVPTNSFQVYGRALAEAAHMTNLAAWGAATPAERISALIVAHSRLVLLGYRAWTPEDVDVMNTIAASTEILIEPKRWPLITAEVFETFPIGFRIALRRAQIAEANYLLSDDEVGDKRRSGIQSETIGESSMFFRMGKAIDTTVSKASLFYLQSYLMTRSVRIARA